MKNRENRSENLVIFRNTLVAQASQITQFAGKQAFLARWHCKNDDQKTFNILSFWLSAEKICPNALEALKCAVCLVAIMKGSTEKGRPIVRFHRAAIHIDNKITH